MRLTLVPQHVRFAGTWVALALTAVGGAALWAQAPVTPSIPSRDLKGAIEWGLLGAPSPYLLRHAGGRNPNPVIVGAIYTPYLRVALAAKAARLAGRGFDLSYVTPELAESVIYVAFRWYCCDRDRPDAATFNPLVPFDYQIARVPATSHPPSIEELRAAVPPLWIRRGIALLSSFGGELPYEDVVLVAAYPLDALTADHDYVIYRDYLIGERPIGELRLARELRTGRVLRRELAHWR